MKKTKDYQISFLFLIFIFAVTNLHSQNLFLKQKSGTFTNFPSTAIKKISFTNSDIVVNTTNEAINISLIDFQYISFVNFQTALAQIEAGSNSLKLFPNPVKDILSVQMNTLFKGHVSIHILSIDGKILVSKAIEDGNTTFSKDISDLPNGIYMCRIKSDNYSETTNFIKN